MNNKTVQQRLCTAPKDEPEEALRFAVAFEEGISQQRNFSGGSEVKTEPVYAKNERPKNPCTQCWLEFSQNHIPMQSQNRKIPQLRSN